MKDNTLELKVDQKWTAHLQIISVMEVILKQPQVASALNCRYLSEANMNSLFRKITSSESSNYFYKHFASMPGIQ